VCESRYHRVLSCDGASIEVADLDGRVRHASLLAYEGEPPRVGDVVVVYCDYALGPADPEEAAAACAELARAAHGSWPTTEGEAR
jgi:hydrogenase maturation factor